MIKRYHLRQKLALKKEIPVFRDNDLSIGDNFIVTGRISNCYVNGEYKNVYVLRDIYRTKYLFDDKEMQEYFTEAI